MSVDRWAKFREIVTDLTEELLPTSPIYRMAKKYNVSPDIAVPLFRQLGAEVAYLVDRKINQSSMQQIPQFVLSLNANKAVNALNLPSEQVQRTKCITELLLATAQEVGQPVLGFIGLQLSQAASIPIEYTMQKRLTNVFASAQRIKTDWDLRGSGRLLQVFPSWVHSYFKLLKQDTVKLHLESFVMNSYAPVVSGGGGQDDESDEGAVQAARRGSVSRADGEDGREEDAGEVDALASASSSSAAFDPSVSFPFGEDGALSSSSGTGAAMALERESVLASPVGTEEAISSYFAKKDGSGRTPDGASSSSFLSSAELTAVLQKAAAKRLVTSVPVEVSASDRKSVV